MQRLRSHYSKILLTRNTPLPICRSAGNTRVNVLKLEVNLSLMEIFYNVLLHMRHYLVCYHLHNLKNVKNTHRGVLF